MLAWLVALSLPLAACVVGEDGTGVDPGDDDGSGSGSGSGSNPGGGISGTIAQDATWSGTVKITGNTTISAGVTVTVEPGTTINIDAGGWSINVNGTFTAAGTKAAPITIAPTAATGFHSGFQIATGGVVTLNYVNQSGGGIHTSGGKAVVVDSTMRNASGDFLVMSGGEVDVSYSEFGNNGAIDATHCHMHFDGSMPNTIKVTNSNISNASASTYGVMFYHGTTANFTNNNWFGAQIHVSTSPGVTGDFTGSWFESAPPAVGGNGGATLTLGPTVAARLTDAGPR